VWLVRGIFCAKSVFMTGILERICCGCARRIPFDDLFILWRCVEDLKVSCKIDLRWSMIINVQNLCLFVFMVRIDR
jgi:predicted amidophosphoribosyltransferase